MTPIKSIIKPIELRHKVARDRLNICILEGLVPEVSASCFDRSLNDIAFLLDRVKKLQAVVEAAKLALTRGLPARETAQNIAALDKALAALKEAK